MRSFFEKNCSYIGSVLIPERLVAGMAKAAGSASPAREGFVCHGHPVLIEGLWDARGGSPKAMRGKGAGAGGVIVRDEGGQRYL